MAYQTKIFRTPPGTLVPRLQPRCAVHGRYRARRGALGDWSWTDLFNPFKLGRDVVAPAIRYDIQQIQNIPFNALDAVNNVYQNARTGLLTPSQVGVQKGNCAQDLVRASGGTLNYSDALQKCNQTIDALIKRQGGTSDQVWDYWPWVAVGGVGLLAWLILK